MKKFRPIKQSDEKDCGVTCLLMIIRYYGGNVSKEYLRVLTNTDKSGTSFLDLSYAMEKLNFESFGLTGRVEDINQSYFPVISHVIINKSFQHFIVIKEYDVKNKTLLIADPATGLEKLDLEEYKKISTSNYLVMMPRGNIINIKPKKILKKTIYKDIRINIKKIIVISIESLIYTFIAIICTFFITVIYKNIDEKIFPLLTYSFIFLTLIKELISYIRNNLIIKWSISLNQMLNEDIYNHLFSLSHFYYKTRGTGEILSKIRDMENVGNIISNIFISCILDITLGILSLITMYIFNLKLSIIVSIFLIIYTLIFLSFKKKYIKNIISIKNENRNKENFLVDTISNIETIKNLNRVKFVTEKYHIYLSKYFKNIKNYQFLSNKKIELSNLINSLSQIIIIIVGYILIKQGNMNQELIMSYIFLESFVQESLSNILNCYLDYQENKISIERVEEFYEIDEEKNNNYNEVINKIDMHNITYSYRKNKKLLSNINLTINKEDKILLYGISGGGKSTLINILSGIEKEYNGTFKINNKTIDKKVNIKNRIALLSQNEKLLNLSIKDNIMLGRDNELDKFNQIVSFLKIDKIIENCPLAYDTLIDESGSNLSGGERERIMIARTLMKDADIYIFDESFANLDIELEREILKEVINYLKEKIVLVVSHRFYNKDLFQKVIKIENGGIDYENND